MIRETLDKVVQRYRKLRFGSAVSGILHTPPLRLAANGPTLLSMVHHRDVCAYLLAAKSFAARVPPSRVVVVADPSLTPQDRETLQQHIAGLEISDAAAWHDRRLPKGGTWERLTAIAYEVRNGYVIQVDADTVALDELDEVATAVAANRAFLLTSEDGLRLNDLAAATRWAKGRAATVQHVQIQAEANLDSLAGAHWRYARACSGFAGFPRGSFTREWLYQVTDAMVGRIGARWSEWGTEQVTSNLVCASQPNALLLPHPKYCNADKRTPATVFVHFIGYARFTSSRYEEAARSFIRDARKALAAG